MISLLAALSLEGLVPILIQLVVVGLVLYLLFWFIGYVGLPDPFAKIAKAIIALVGVIYLIQLLLALT